MIKLVSGLVGGFTIGAFVGFMGGAKITFDDMSESRPYKVGQAVIAEYKRQSALAASLESEFQALADDINAKFGENTIIMR